MKTLVQNKESKAPGRNRYLGILTAVGGVLALASATSAAPYIDVNFDSNAVGDNYTVAAGVGVNDGLVGSAPNNITSVKQIGNYSLVVDASHSLNYTTSTAGQGLESFNPQTTPDAPETWFIQFDYTRLVSTDGILAFAMINNSGSSMLGHPNNATLFRDSFAGISLAVGGTYTLRLEVDSGTSNARAYVDGVLGTTFTASNTGNGFGGITITSISGTSTDFIMDNFQGGIVPEPASLGLMVFGGLGIIARRKRRQVR